MRYSSNFSKTLAATAGVVAAACVAGPALATSGGTEVDPAGAPFAASLSGNLTVSVDGISATCTTSGATGTLPAAPSNASASGPITVNLGAPTVSGCTAPLVGITVTTSGAWTITGTYSTTGITGSLNIPQGGIVVHTSGLATCTGTAPGTGSVSLPGTWTNGTDSSSHPSKFAVTGTVPVTVSGGGICPSTTLNASLSATYAIKDSANSATPIVIGPPTATTTTTTAAPTTTTTTTGGTGSASAALPFLGTLFASISGGTTTTS